MESHQGSHQGHQEAIRRAIRGAISGEPSVEPSVEDRAFAADCGSHKLDGVGQPVREDGRPVHLRPRPIWSVINL